MYKVFIDGNQGTTGLRIAQRLAGRKELMLLALSEKDRKDLPSRVAMAKEADITFLCLPDEASRELVAALSENEGRIIDASTAHRTNAAFVYGFAELSQTQEKQIAASNRVAVPGCHASGTVALIKPLVEAGLLDSHAMLCITSLTGYSGGGKPMIADYESEQRDINLYAPRPYAVTQNHKHLSEIMHVCGLNTAPVFQPIVMDAYSGMLVSLPIHQGMLAKPVGIAEVSKVYADFFTNQPMVKVLETNAENNIDSIRMMGLDAMEIFVTGNDERMIAYARFDNLGKGASGAAIECMNLMLGLDKSEGLEL